MERHIRDELSAGAQEGDADEGGEGRSSERANAQTGGSARTRDDGDGEEADTRPALCLVCRKSEIEYMCIPCRCNTCCKKCAMKLASGGYCKKCGEMFAQFKRLRP